MKKGIVCQGNQPQNIIECPPHLFGHRPHTRFVRLSRGHQTKEFHLTSKPRISVKIVSGVERSAIPDTIKMSEAAAR